MTGARQGFRRHSLGSWTKFSGRNHFRQPTALGPDRLATLTIHHRRHAFISYALAGGRTLAEVRAAAGQANVSITSTYLHVAVEDQVVGNLVLFA